MQIWKNLAILAAALGCTSLVGCSHPQDSGAAGGVPVSAQQAAQQAQQQSQIAAQQAAGQQAAAQRAAAQQGAPK